MSSLPKDLILNENNLLKQEVTCRICLDLYTEPVTLICQHTFCLECFKGLFSNVKSPKSIQCPICKQLINRRSYYINEHFQALLELLKIFNKSVTTWEKRMADSKSRLEKYLDDCVKQQSQKNQIFYLSSDDDSCIDLIGNPKDIASNSKINVNSHVPKVQKKIEHKIKPLKCIKKIKTKKKQPKKRNKDTTKEDNIEEQIKIDENDSDSPGVSNINIEENKIVRLIEDDFLQNIENEFGDKMNNDKSITKQKKQYNSSFNWKQKTTDISKKTSLDWSRVEFVNKKIEQKEKKYKQLNISTELNKSKSKPQEKEQIVIIERFDKASLEDTPVEASIHIKTEDESIDKLDFLLKCIEEDKTNTENKNNTDSEDIFLMSTQILNDSQKNNKQQQEIVNKELENSPSKLIVNVEVHHNLNGTPNNKPAENNSEHTIEPFKEKTDEDTNDDVISATEKTPESMKHIRAKRKYKKPVETKTPNKIPTEKNISEKQKEIKLDLKIANEQKSTMITSLENSINCVNAVLSQCSNYVNSESLFSDSFCSKESRKSKISPHEQQNTLVADQYYSLPLPTQNHTSQEFICTVIPFLKNIKHYYTQITSLSDKICSETEIIKNNLGCNNERLTEIKLDSKVNSVNVEIQTDPLECPKCSYNFNSENNLSKTLDFVEINFSSNEFMNKSENNTKDNFQTSLNSNEITNSHRKEKVNRQLKYNDDPNRSQKQKFKRIRPASPDSDSESIKSKKSKTNYSKLLYQDVDVIFHSETCETNILSDAPIKKIINECDKEVQELLNVDKEVQEVINVDKEIERSFENNHLDIVTNNVAVDQLHDNELDKEVENLTTSVVEIEDSVNSDRDIFDDDNIVESTPQKLKENNRQKSKFEFENNLLEHFTPIKDNLQIEICESPVPKNDVPLATNKSVSEINSKNKICIVYTRLTRVEISAVESAVTKFHVKSNKNFSEFVTHLVVAVDDHNRLKDHTMKYLLAIAHSVWIVSFAWIRDSLQQNRLLPEESYEVLDVSGNPGPKLSRLTRITNPLFKNFVIHCADLITTVNKREMEDVIIKLGGEVRSKPNDLVKVTGKICLILSETNVTQDFYNYQMWRDKLNVLVVDIEWLSRTVGQYQITSVRPYILCLEEGINNLGYPWNLIAPVTETQLTIST